MAEIFYQEVWTEEFLSGVEDPEHSYPDRKFSFEKLVVWNLSVELTVWTYQLVSDFPHEEKFLLSHQIRKSAISIPSNLAEGSSRFSDKDKRRFYQIAYGSALELLNQMHIAHQLGFVDDAKYTEARRRIQRITAMIHRLCMDTQDKPSTKTPPNPP